MVLGTERRDIWRSREEATEKFRKYLHAWDPRAFQRWAEFGFRDLPTAIYPSTSASPGAVTLTTTKHQEVMSVTYINPTKETIVEFPGENHEENRASQKSIVPGRQVYRCEAMPAFKLMPHLAPPTLLMSGKRSPLYLSGKHTAAAKITGTGFEGSGGVEAGLVRHVVIDKGTYTLPMEKVGSVAEAMGPWIQQVAQQWKKDKAHLAQEWGPLSIKEKSTFPPEWTKIVETKKSRL